MREIPLSEFTRNFGYFREIAQREPIALMSNGSTTGYFVSTVEYEELQRFKTLVRHSFATADLTAEDIDQITNGAMSPEHDHLDTLLDTP